MYKQIGFVDLIKSIQSVVKKNTGLECYDHVDLNTKSPFYYAEAVGKRPSHSKTMYRDIFTIWIHCIAEESTSSVPVYNMIQELEEALTEDIVLPDPYQLVMQTNTGVQTIKTDETGEKHAVVAFEFMICYGFRCKN